MCVCALTNLILCIQICSFAYVNCELSLFLMLFSTYIFMVIGLRL